MVRRHRSWRQAILALFATVALLVPFASGVAAADEGGTGSEVTANVGVTKTIVGGGDTFAPGVPFTYDIKYTCSSQTAAGCVDAQVVDLLPAEVEFDSPVTLGTDPAEWSQQTVTVDGVERTQITVTFNADLGSGQQGLAVGRTGHIYVTVHFPEGTPDGTLAHNCATMDATNALPATESCADATSKIVPTYGVDLTKEYAGDYDGDTATSGVQGTGPSTTLQLTATVGGNQPASSVTVVDPDPDHTTNNDPFDSFDLTAFGELDLPDGVQAEILVKSAGGYVSVGTFGDGETPSLPGASGIAAGDVTGITVVYTRADGDPIAAGTKLKLTAGVQLRDELRGSGSDVPVGTIPNQAAVAASYPDHADETDTDTASYTVTSPQADVDASKSISPGSAQQNSGAEVTMTVGGKNSGNVPASEMTVTDPSGDATPFDTFAFKEFSPLSLPTGVAATVQVRVAGDWITVGEGLADGATPSLPDSVAAADVVGVKYIYTGSIAPGDEIKNSFVTTLNDSEVTGDLDDVNCVTANLTTDYGTGAVQDNACADFSVVAISTSTQANKSFSPDSATAHTGATTTVTLQGRNASNVPVEDFALVEPGTGSDATFEYFDFAGFGKLNAPSGTEWLVEVFDGSTWLTVGTYPAGVTPPTSDLPNGADDVQGVRYSLASGELPTTGSYAQRGLSTTIELTLRNTQRSSGTPITSAEVNNCLTVATGEASDSDCAVFTVNEFKPGTGTGVHKNIVESSVVQNTGEATDVQLTGTNGANAPVTQIVLEDSNGIDPGTNGTNDFWNSFTFQAFGNTAWPTGTSTLTVEYYDGSGWHEVGTYSSAGTPSLPDGVNAGDVQGLRYTWTGDFAPNETVTARFSATVTDGAAIGTVKDCVQQTYSGGLLETPVVNSDCDTVSIVAQSYEVTQSKRFSPDKGTVGLDPAAATTAWLTVQNTSNVGLDQIVLTDPNSSSTAPNPFDRFTLTGFESPRIPGHDRVDVSVSTDGGSTWTDVATNVWNGGTIPTPPNADDVTAVRFTVHPNPGQADHIRPGDTFRLGINLKLRDTVRGSDVAVEPGTIENCFTTDATAGQHEVEIKGDPCATFTAEAQSPGASASKTWDPSSELRDDPTPSVITIKGRNAGNMPVDALVIQDPALEDGTQPAVGATAFDYYDVTGLSGLRFPQGADRVQIDVLTADGTWHPGTAQAALPTGESINGVPLGDIVGVRATFTDADGGTLPVVTNAGETGNVGIDVALRTTLRGTGAPVDVPPAGSLTVPNTSGASVIVNDNQSSWATADATHEIVGGTVKVSPDKSLYPAGSTGNAGPDSAVTYRLRINNVGDRNLVAPVVLDTFDPALLRYDPTLEYPLGKYEFDANGSTLTGDGLNAYYDEDAGTVTFHFADGDYLAPGETAYLKLVLFTQPGLPAGTGVTNTYGVTWDVQANGEIDCTAGEQAIGDITYCTDTQDVTISKAQAMGSVKWIKGDPVAPTNVITAGNPCPADASLPEYTKYPCIAHTHTGGIFDYALRVTVTGNVSVGTARVVDVLPFVGDTGLIDTRDRNTEWTPTLAGEVTVEDLPDGAEATVYYATTAEPCGAPTDPLDHPTAAWCDDWTTTAPTDLSTIAAIGVEVVTAEGQPLAPADAFTLRWQMQAPDTSPGVDSEYYPGMGAGPIAWNSFAFTGLPTDGSGWLLPAEPNKVGIDLTNPSVTVSKTSHGGEGTFDFTLTEGEVDDATPLPGSVTTSADDPTGTFTWGPPDYSLTPGGVYTLQEDTGQAWQSSVGECTNRGEPLETLETGDDFVTFVAPAHGQVVCSFDNTKRPTVTVHKTAVGGDGDFAFVLTEVDPETGEPAGEGRTDTVSTQDGSGTLTWGPDGLTPDATYTLSETAQDDWESEFDGCFVGEEELDTAVHDGVVTFTAAAGADITCSFTNTTTIEVLPTTETQTPPPSTPTSPPDTETPPTEAPPATSSASSEPIIDVLPTSSSQSGSIAYTGVPTWRFAWVALTLLGAGGALLLIGRIRRQPRRH